MIGRQLAHYLVGEKLGEGGMGIVYMGTDTRLKRPVALKFLTRALPSEAKERKRFLREARAASSVNHPNVCVIHAIEEVEGEEFIVMEFVEGVTLRKWAHHKRDAQRSKLLPLKDTLAVVNQVAEGLDAAHKKGIVHRDVKPENVMIRADGRAKIMDFGLAKLAGESKLTRTGATVGTVAYMSPEQVQGGEIDAQSDIYSLGVLLYELLAGRTPFIADHVMGMMYAIVNTDPEPIQQVRPGLDPEIAAVVMRCLAKVKKERYATMSEVIRDISGYEEMQRTAVVRRVKREGREDRLWGRFPLPRFERKNIAWMGTLAILVAATVVYFLAENRPDNTANTSQGGKLTITSTEQKTAEG
ncbi:MAG TPA: serine/threonine-protein kinase, partial [Bacteroidota bacterium]